MLLERTVLVLGAGASCDYGFPDGRKLVRDIVAICRNDGEQRRAILGSGYDLGSITELGQAVAAAKPQSIDAFLHWRPEYQSIGRTAIAVAMIPYEKVQALEEPTGDDWLGYFFALCARGAQTSFEPISSL